MNTLISSTNLEDRIEAAAQATLTSEQQNALIGDEPEVMMMLAGNAGLTRENLLLLAQDRSVDVRLTVAARPALDADVLVALSLDESEAVRAAAQKRPDYHNALMSMLLRCGVTPNLEAANALDLLNFMPDLWAWPEGVEIVGWVQPTDA
ncbi:hypothetical protein ICM05_05370 [Leucobacter sp. cx-42]|uniref:hypothetical protein n=1 Tax=unclassified Leucobacter TaxID=2621730 RepID=UPI00165EA060|nr:MULTISPECIES: hypothetical protein [unclassified Leucobacter]MBC9954076.1 hypothetical protein [Leucobacter sp. cx-42]